MSDLEDARDRLLAALKRETPRLKRYDNYFEGNQPLKFVSPLIAAKVDPSLIELWLEIPRYGTEVYENRLDIEGFRYAGSDSSDDELWSWWQANDGDLQGQQAHRKALSLSRAYAIVGLADDDSSPLITVESPFSSIHEDDPRTHEVKYGLKTWTEVDGTPFISLYHPNGRVTWRETSSDLVEDSSESNDFNLCRLVPLINEPDMLGGIRTDRFGQKYDQRLGRSIFHSVMPLVDAINKILSDMMVSAEFHAMPRRWATGLSEDDFVDEDGNPLSTFELVAGRVWGVTNEKAQFGQFPEATLSNFHDTLKLLSQQAAQMLALPPHYLSFTGDNPASADAIKASETQLVKQIERKQTTFATRWERVQRLALLTMGRPDSPDLRSIETLWRDPSTPTVAQKTDATVKLVQANVVPRQQAWEDLGYTATQQGRMADWFAQNGTDPQVTDALAKINGLGAPVGTP